MNMRVLSKADIDQSIRASDAIEAMRIAFSELSDGRAIVPIRGSVASACGVTLLMPGFLSGMNALGAKIVSVFPENSMKGRPPIQGAVLLLDADTGTPKALLDGTRLTEIRTAAGSGLATELLADDSADILTVFGAGAQGRAHIEILMATRRLSEVRILSKSTETAEVLVTELRNRGDLMPNKNLAELPRIMAMCDPREALDGAGLVVTATTSTTPVFDSRDLESGAHVNAVGSYRPDMQEIDADLVKNARVVVDQREAVWEEAGDLIIPHEAGFIDEKVVDAELGEIVNGDASPGRGEFTFTLFKSVGNAAQDVAIAEMVLSFAEEMGLGSMTPF